MNHYKGKLIKKRIGIFSRTDVIPFYYYTIIQELMQEDNIELIFILDNREESSTSLHEKTYHNFFKIEEKILSYISHEIKENTKEVKIPKELLNDNNIQNKNFDLIIQLDTEYPVCDEIINTAKDGVIGIFTQQKISFWQVYMREDVTSFNIELLTKESRRVLITGKLQTMRFVTEMRVRLMKESGAFLIAFIKEYAKSGKFNTTSHPNPTLFDMAKPTIPTVFQQINYVLKTTALFGKIIFKRVIQKKQARFHVAFLWQKWQDAKLSEGVEIETPKNHFYADPYVWKKDGRIVCFLEDYDYTTHQACISAVELFEDGSYKILGKVIKEDFHLSFPYLFSYKDELYMIPESTASSSIRLYKCTSFPMKWEYQYDLMQDIKTADTILFPLHDKWWMLTNLSTKNNYDQASQLYAFYSDSPLSKKWRPHNGNPIVFDSKQGRNGGILFTDDNIPIRGRQKQKFNKYGASFSIAKIKELTPDSFCEEEIADIEPNFFKNIEATHHIHSHNGITVYDFMREERID